MESHTKTVNMGRRLGLAICSALFMAACGNGSDASDKTAEPSRDESSSRKLGYNINNFEFSFTGDPVKQYDYDGANLILTGGCIKGEGMGIGFSDTSKATQPEYFHFSFGDRSSPAPGDTGTFAIGKVEWMNGQNFDPAINAHVANMFIGDGTLTIDEHTGRGMGGRMKGSVEGAVENEKSGQRAVVSAKFDVNLACAR
ncbi:hypothetical protein [Hyphococcus sp.]|uniref:hypothetical protein n=1 Tax=Hyphococcus sp. TaxID=2038636 RepID=UPI003CCB8D62